MESVAICVFLTAICLMFFGLFYKSGDAESRQWALHHAEVRDCIAAREKECALSDSACFSEVVKRCEYTTLKP